jgi:hypothetical protein
MGAVRVVVVLAALAAAAACETSSTPATQPRAGCAAEADAVFRGGTQWAELATGLGRNASDCLEYFVTVPPQDNDRTSLRSRKAFDEVRSASPRIHPVAEIRYTGETGWREWATAEEQTSYVAGVEARRRMEEAGLDVERGETWAFNELSPEVLADEPGWREDVLEFMRGLYDGGPGMPKAKGIVFNVFVPSDTTDLAAYKSSLKAWFEDEAFWIRMEKYVDFFAEEVYPSPLTWGVPGTSLEERRDHLDDYLFHMLELASRAPDTASLGGAFLGGAYVPLANAAWPHEAIGKTNAVSAETMSAFVSAQVDAIRDFRGAQREDMRQKIGFAWAPNEAEPSYSDSGRDVILERLTAALRSAYEEDGDPCDDGACEADVEGAAFNDAWKTFATWD